MGTPGQPGAPGPVGAPGFPGEKGRTLVYPEHVSCCGGHVHCLWPCFLSKGAAPQGSMPVRPRPLLGTAGALSVGSLATRGPLEPESQTK